MGKLESSQSWSVLLNPMPQWAHFGKQNWRRGLNLEWTCDVYRPWHQILERVLAFFDSWTVVMEVEIRQGVCNNSPAECTSP